MSDLRRKLKRFLSGKESLEGRGLFDAWYKSFDDTAVPGEMPPADVERELKNIKHRSIHDSEAKPSLLPYWRIAAAVLLVVAAGVYMYRVTSHAPPGPEDFTAYTTVAGERRQVVLSDGTSIWLNARTELRAPKAFDGDTREVYLSGEGYFEVARNPDKPFIIHTGELTTMVLGTVFNVRHYEDEHIGEVAVISGKVSVDYKSHNAILTRGKKVTAGEDLFGESSFDDFDRYSRWKDGKLVLENRPVTEVLQSVNRFYGLDIRIRGSKIGSCRISTTLEPMPEQDLINLLCLLLNSKAQKENSTYWISGDGCNE